MKKSTTSELKKANINAVRQYLYQVRSASKQNIGTELNLSRPTVNQILKELEESDLIEKGGYFHSTGGRKAEVITFRGNYRIALGVEILKESFEIVAINLYGNILKSEKFSVSFSNTSDYFHFLCDKLLTFAGALPCSFEEILGVGIVLQGLISSDGTCVTYGKILDCTGLHISVFSDSLPWPCKMLHDAESAANVELWEQPGIKDAIFFHIRENMSGAFIVNGLFLQGKELKSGVFEHMIIVPNGKPCYCGKKGCVETYCSLQALLKPTESMKTFMYQLRSGHPAFIERWQDYLKYLSVAIDNLHMVIDYDVILGGSLGQYLIPEDIEYLHSLVKKRSTFPTERTFIRISSSSSVPIAKGAALLFVKNYLASILN